MTYDDPTPGVAPLPPSKTSLGFRDGATDALVTVTLKPGEHLALRSVPSTLVAPRAANRHVAVAALWDDPGTPAVEEGVFRVRGAARSEALLLSHDGSAAPVH